MKVIFCAALLLLQTYLFAQTKEDTVNLNTASGIIKGSLFTPADKSNFPVLILLAGSGPTDRYGNNPMGIAANSYKMLAEALIKENIGVLVYDKRGVAKSMDAVKKEADLRFDDYVNDAVLWIDLLKHYKQVKSIFIGGHSEGSLIGMLAAQKIKVQGYISIAGPAKGIAEIITEQYAQQLPKAAIIVDSLFKRLQNNQPLDTVLPYLASIFRPSVQPYIKSWMKYIPCEEIKKLSLPILILQGGNDIQVAAIEATMLKKCNENATLILLDSMNHILKTAPADRKQNIATYNNPTLPLYPGLSNAIIGFMKKNDK